jgi:CRP/FNR family transcriptional regulator, cyclic AMP receptor protein
MVLLDERKRTADIVASTFTDVLVIGYDTIFTIFNKNPKIFSILMLNLCRLLAKRLKGTSEEIKRLNVLLATIESDNKAA